VEITKAFILLERETGFEPATSSLGSWHFDQTASLCEVAVYLNFSGPL
jgi:hypothetical protein